MRLAESYRVTSGPLMMHSTFLLVETELWRRSVANSSQAINSLSLRLLQVCEAEVQPWHRRHHPAASSAQPLLQPFHSHSDSMYHCPIIKLTSPSSFQSTGSSLKLKPDCNFPVEHWKAKNPRYVKHVSVYPTYILHLVFQNCGSKTMCVPPPDCSCRKSRLTTPLRISSVREVVQSSNLNLRALGVFLARPGRTTDGPGFSFRTCKNPAARQETYWQGGLVCLRPLTTAISWSRRLG